MRFLTILLTLLSLICPFLQGAANLEDLLKQAEEIEDPIKREKLKRRLINMYKNVDGKYTAPDYSTKTVTELIDTVLSFDGIPSSQLNSIKYELGQRQSFKDSVRKRVEEFDVRLLNHPNPSALSVSDPFVLSSLASAGGKDFQIEIIKKCFDHPIVVRMGESGFWHLFPILARVSADNKEAILDELIEEGRIEKGSLFEKTWRKKLTDPTRNDSAGRDKRNPSLHRERPGPTTPIETQDIVATTNTSNRWAVILAVILVLGGLFVWLRKK